jgi:hypothetical protein
VEGRRDCQYLTPKAELRPSPIGGVGIFAREPIARHELVAFWAGCTISYAELQALPPEVSELPVQVWFDTWLGPTRVEDIEPADRMNHSCEPNCGVRGQAAVVARRDIASGEELTFDYGTTDTIGLHLPCKCGAPTCRGVVTSDDWRDEAFQERNREYLSLYVHELIRLLRGEPACGIPPGGIPSLRRPPPGAGPGGGPRAPA